MSQNILITGASGLIGSRLTELLLAKGHSVVHLGRHKKTGGVTSFVWNVDSGVIESGALNGVTTIIHLAGAGVADKRWTKKRKNEILVSRTRSSEVLFEALQKGDHAVTSVISASAIGYYGFTDNEKIYKEDSLPGTDFLAQVTRQWEDAVDHIKTLSIRIVKLRIGIVLSEQGGALKEMAAPVKLFAGAPLGSGDQYISWIHLDDLCNMFIKAVEDKHMQGAYNAVGPYPVTNRDLTKAIAATLHKPLLLPSIPGAAIKLLLGEMGNLVLYGSKVSSEKIQHEGFKLQYTDLNSALKNLLT